MLPSPSSSPRPILHNRTNFNPLETKPQKLQQTLSFLPTPPKCRTLKRPLKAVDDVQRKRPKGDDSDMREESDSDSEQSACGSDAPPSVAPVRRRPTTIRGLTHRSGDVSTRPILQSFVSSKRLDSYVCHAADLVLPPIYASSYSHGARGGGKSLLAVATEHGFVQIMNTSHREPWDLEPARAFFQIHNNGIFDVQWNESDSLLATGSADQTTKITCLETSTLLHTLRGHTSSVKRIAWDPTNPNLLSTGGRDGSIHLWDLRQSMQATADPVASIFSAHDEIKSRKKTNTTSSITGLVYNDMAPFNLISSGTTNGILRCWDVRLLQSKKRAPKPRPIVMSLNDPTCFHGSRRPRGIKSLCKGSGPTAGVLFGLSADARVHTYTMSTLVGCETSYTHSEMSSGSFYVGISVSPCGRWLSCGGPTGNAFLFDVHNAGRRGVTLGSQAVKLNGGPEVKGEIGAVDWSAEGVATCSDEGVVRFWRPDIDIHRKCISESEAERWHWDWAL
ncbi:WD40-repeat-containing domain protein [Mucidula mucida]|nr:WD40-repeat-containing domain protein [Mucidula mucida]